MNFDLTDDQVALRDGIRSLLEGRFDMERVRGGFDRSMHAELAEAGVFSLLADGFSRADAAIVYEELGRACVPGPLVWCFGREDVVTGLARPAGAAWIEHLDAVDRVLVVDADGIEAIPASAIGGTPHDWPLDPLTPVTHVDALPAGERIGDADAAGALGEDGALLTAAFAIGLADACLRLAVDYAMDREQFDRPIGSFQAVKHLCAEMAVKVEVARAAVHAAACLLDDPDSGDAARALAGAKLLAVEAAVHNGRGATQVHGGMGFTWEVDVHLYLKRAWVLETQFGSGDSWADLVAATLPAPA